MSFTFHLFLLCLLVLASLLIPCYLCLSPLFHFSTRRGVVIHILTQVAEDVFTNAANNFLPLNETIAHHCTLCTLWTSHGILHLIECQFQLKLWQSQFPSLFYVVNAPSNFSTVFSLHTCFISMRVIKWVQLGSRNFPKNCRIYYLDIWWCSLEELHWFWRKCTDSNTGNRICVLPRNPMYLNSQQSSNFGLTHLFDRKRVVTYLAIFHDWFVLHLGFSKYEIFLPIFDVCESFLKVLIQSHTFFIEKKDWVGNESKEIRDQYNIEIFHSI